MKRLLVFLVLLCLTPTAALSAGTTSYTFSTDANEDELRIVQDAYLSKGVYQNLGLKSPQDMTVVGRTMYIADTGNRRVVTVDLDSGAVTEIQGEFAQPVGIAADTQGRIYVADYQKNCAFRFSAQGVMEQKFERPVSPAYGVNNLFKPQSIAPDGSGGIYLVADGAQNGIVQMNGKGEFVGFFASNIVSIPLKYRLYDLVLNDEQMARYGLGIPGKFNTIMRGVDGLIYAMQIGADVRVQKLNYAGIDLFAGNAKLSALTYPVDMAMARDGSILALTMSGMITQYTRDGVLLYSFGGLMTDMAREGLIQSPAGIGVDERDNVYVLDKSTGYIHVWEPTGTQRLTREAISRYDAGHYAEAGRLLDEVLTYNSASYYARLYRGRVFMHMGDYRSALEQFRLANDRAEYSDAFWELRNIFLAENGLWIMTGLVVLAAVWIIRRIRQPRRREDYNAYTWSVRLPSQWHGLRPKYLKRAIVHPLDTAYEIKQRHMGGYAASATLIVLTTAALCCKELFSGFLFSTPADDFPLLMYFGGILAAVMLFVISNFFITSINDGEATLAMIMDVTAYAMTPLLLGLPVITLLSNGMTGNEALIIHTLTIVMYLVCAVNLSAMLMEIHHYTFRQYVKSLILTILFMLLCILVLSLLWLLLKQAIDFFTQVWTEVSVRE